MSQLSSGSPQDLQSALSELQLSTMRLQQLAVTLRQQQQSPDPIQQAQTEAILELFRNVTSMQRVLGGVFGVVLAGQPSREAATRVRDGTSNTIAF